jgi:transcriptional enhancer factor
MGLQQQRSCVPPHSVPALDTTAQQRAILQERSANRPHDFNSQSTSTLKRSRSPSPLDHAFRRRPAPTGSYFTGNVHAQHIGLAGFSAERSEKQIEVELKRLYRMLSQSDKYQKYREKQPVMTVAEVLAKEARELAEEQARERAAQEAGRTISKKEEKDKTVWPEFLEQAFWRGKPNFWLC